MKLIRIQLHPFAGVSNRTVDFKGGLNVVLGPNEAGKSTFVSALRLSLFMPTNVGRKMYKKEIERFMPITGGDTIQIKVEFEVNGRSHVLEKAWGGLQTSNLTLPGGELFTDPKTVQDKLQELLEMSPATWEKVLFAFQSRLVDTLDQLSQDSSPNKDLTDLLRKAVFETDGVRVEDLGTAILAIEEEYFGRWDRQLERPEANRGIESPWKKGVGTILDAYYVMKDVEKRLENVNRHVQEMDKWNAELRKSNEKVTKVEVYIEKNKGFVKTARERSVLEADIRALTADLRAMRKAVRDWPKKEKQIEVLESEKKEIGPIIEDLVGEKKIAEEYEGKKDKIRILRNAEPKQKTLEKTTRDHTKLKVVTSQELASLIDIQGQITITKAKMSAGQLSLNLHARKDLTIKLSKGLETGRNRKISAGKSMKEEVEGQVLLEHTDWDLLVRSGEVPFIELERELEKLEQKLKDELARVKCSSINVAQVAQAKFAESKRKLDEIQQSFDDSLEDEDFEALRASLDGKVDEPDRPLTEITEELAAKRVRREHLDGEITRLSEQVDEWGAEYGSLEEIKELQGELKNEKKDLKVEVEELIPLPARIKDPDDFIEKFDKKKDDLDLQKEKRSDIREELAELRGSAPEESEEEFAIYLKEAEAKFHRKLAKGRAIEIIRQQFEFLVEEMDSSTMDPWADSLRQVIEPLTAGRYEATSDLDDKEMFAKRKDGVDIPVVLLSEGTKVGIGLAIRLAMAGYFLKNRDGFLVMDDPLVDLDPDRQEAASKIVKEFAKNTQVIVLTCHPTHADMLGGEKIELDSVAS